MKDNTKDRPSEINGRETPGPARINDTQDSIDLSRLHAYMSYVNPQYYPADSNDEISIISLINIFLKRRWVVFTGIILFIIAGFLYSRDPIPEYTASAQFLATSQADMTSRLGTLIGTNRVDGFELDTSPEYYSELLKSNVFLERVLSRAFIDSLTQEESSLYEIFNISGESNEERLSRGLSLFRRNLKVSVSVHRTRGASMAQYFVNLEFTSHDRDLSVDILKAVIEELDIYNHEFRDNRARASRHFIETQLKKAESDLKESEAKLAEFTARNRQIATPALQVEFDRLTRIAKINEEVYLVLKKQYELAKIQEQETKPSLEIMQRPMRPLSSSNMPRRNVVAIFAVIGIFISSAFIFVSEFINRAKNNKDNEDMQEFIQNLNKIKNDILLPVRIFKK